MADMKFDIIVALDENDGIGKDGQLPWPRLKADMLHFKDLTSKAPAGQRNAVIMGRKTWDSLPFRSRPLPDRTNIVLTRDKKSIQSHGMLKGPRVATSFEHALELAHDAHKAFVIGGGEIYRLAMRHPGCSTIHMTRILCGYKCDTYFPDTGYWLYDKCTELRGFVLDRLEHVNEAGLSYEIERYRRVARILE